MKNDKAIFSTLSIIQSKINYVLSMDTIDAYTDRVIEEIIEKGKELEKLHENNGLE